MSRNKNAWERVSTEKPCPICGKSDWCLLAKDGSAAICPRTEDGAVKWCGEAGWLHQLRQDDDRRPVWQRVREVRIDKRDNPPSDFRQLADECSAAIESDGLQDLADNLGLAVEGLKRLRVGWAAKYGSWSFPMRDAAGRIIGIRLRRSNGSKWAVPGSKNGLFVPTGLAEATPLLICEGPTDTAALLDLGFNAVGRPSCNGGGKLLLELVKRRGLGEAVILADGDTAGRRGARALAAVLVAFCPTVRVMIPPEGAKDGRGWKQSGATHWDIRQRISETQAEKLEVSIVRTDREHTKGGV